MNNTGEKTFWKYMWLGVEKYQIPIRIGVIEVWTFVSATVDPHSDLTIAIMTFYCFVL